MRRCSAALVLVLVGLVAAGPARASVGDPLRCGPVRDAFDRGNSTDPGPLWNENFQNMVIAGNTATSASGTGSTANPLMTFTGTVSDANRACVRVFGGDAGAYDAVALRQGATPATSLFVELRDNVGGDGNFDTVTLRKGNGGAQLDTKVLAHAIPGGRMSVTATDDGSRYLVDVEIETAIGGGAVDSEILQTSHAGAGTLGNGIALGSSGGATLDDFSTPNGTPTVSTGSGSTAYTEHGAPVVIAPDLTVADDDVNLQGAQVYDSQAYQTGDALQFTNTPKITASFNNGAQLILTGTATVAEYQAALRSVRFSATSGAVITPKAIQFRVDDGASYSALAQRLIATTAIDDTPVLTASSTPLAYTEGDGAKVVDPGLVVDDPDRSTLTNASARIVGGDGTETLGFVDQNGITGSFAGGVLTLTGTATFDKYQAALRSVTYTNSGENPSGARSVEFRAADRTLESAPVSRAIALVAVDDAAVVTTTAAPLGYTQGAAGVPVDPGLTVTDVDDTQLEGATVTVGGAAAGDTLGFVTQNGISGTFAGGVLTLTGTAPLAAYQAALRSVTFATARADTPRTVAFAVNDGDAMSAGASRTIAVALAPAVTPTPTATPTVAASPTVTASPMPTVTSSATVTATTVPTATPTASATVAPKLTLTAVSLGKQRLRRGKVQTVRFTLNGPATVTLRFVRKRKQVTVTRTFEAAGSYRIRKPWHYVAGHWRVTVTAGDAPPVTKRFRVRPRP